MTWTCLRDGTIFISAEQAARWAYDPDLRRSVRAAQTTENRLWAVCLVGGTVVDVWQADHWQCADG
jgi:hypothetical protein